MMTSKLDSSHRTWTSPTFLIIHSLLNSHQLPVVSHLVLIKKFNQDHSLSQSTYKHSLMISLKTKQQPHFYQEVQG